MVANLKKFLFVDLDDTLFQTLEKCHGAQNLAPVAFLKDGLPISYTTAKQRSLWEFLDKDLCLIPTTARNFDALSRVRLEFRTYAIINYGGVVLDENGELDRPYLASISAAMQLAHPGLIEIMQLIDDYAIQNGFAGRSRLVEDFGTPFYVVLKDPLRRPESLAEVERLVVQPWLNAKAGAYWVHRNGNNLAILPRSLNKAHAVAYLQSKLIKQHGEILSFGMGDSISDATFMGLCDYAIIPRATQLAKEFFV